MKDYWISTELEVDYCNFLGVIFLEASLSKNKELKWLLSYGKIPYLRPLSIKQLV